MKPKRPEGGRTHDEILEWVYERGYALRARRRIVRLAAVISFSLATVAVTVMIGDQQPQGIKIIDTPPSVVTPAPDATLVPTPMPTATSTPTDRPTPAPECRNSTDPQCGRFRWDPAPGPNAPLEFDVRISPANPRVGEEVTVVVTVRDPDSEMSEIFINFDVAMSRSPTCAPDERHGPWTPPEKTPGAMTRTATHTFDEPGEHYVHILAFSQGAHCNQNPYGSRGETQRTFTVTAAPSPSPSSLIPMP